MTSRDIQLPAGAYHAGLDLQAGGSIPLAAQSIRILPDGSKGYVIYGTDEITVFDPGELAVSAQLRAASTVRLQRFAYDAAARLLYMSSTGAPVVTVLDTTTDEIVRQIPISGTGRGIAVSQGPSCMWPWTGRAPGSPSWTGSRATSRA